MICISIGSNDFNFCCQVIENYEFVEIRMDLCNFSEFQYKQLFQKTKKAIATFSKNQIEIDSYEYNLLFKSMDYGAKIIDINYNWNIEVKEKLIQYAKSNKVEIICSYHNFDLTPSKYDLLHIIENINAYKIDFIKMATFVNNRVDAARLISLYEFNFPNLLIVGMG